MNILLWAVLPWTIPFRIFSPWTFPPWTVTQWTFPVIGIDRYEHSTLSSPAMNIPGFEELDINFPTLSSSAMNIPMPNILAMNIPAMNILLWAVLPWIFPVMKCLILNFLLWAVLPWTLPCRILEDDIDAEYSRYKHSRNELSRYEKSWIPWTMEPLSILLKSEKHSLGFRALPRPSWLGRSREDVVNSISHSNSTSQFTAVMSLRQRKMTIYLLLTKSCRGRRGHKDDVMAGGHTRSHLMITD